MDEDSSIDFSAKYKNWIVIKKASVREDTTPEEVAFHIALIRQTIDKKAFELLGIDTKSLDEYAATATASMRKSFSSLAEAVKKLDTKEAKGAISRSCQGKSELSEIAGVYLFRKIAQSLKFDFDVSSEMLSKAYPHLKLPMPPGRKPKG